MHLLQEKELKKEESNPTNSLTKIKKKTMKYRNCCSILNNVWVIS